ncbi:unnamed protein product, partial [Allacma fusca]
LHSVKTVTSQRLEVVQAEPKNTLYQGWFNVSGKELDELKQSLASIDKADGALIS